MNTISMAQHEMMGEYSTSQAYDDHSQESYQLAHLSVLYSWELGSVPPGIGSLFGKGKPTEHKS